MAYYIKKPVVIEARRVYNSDALIDVAEWMNDHGYPWLVGDALDPASLRVKGSDEEPTKGIWILPDDGSLMIRTLEGDMKVSRGDHVIKGVEGEFYPCKPDIFVKTYEVTSQK